MKIKEGFMLREVAGNYLVVPVGTKALDFNGMITLNKTGAFLWKELIEEIEYDYLVDKMVTKYNITKEVAQEDLNDFLKRLKDNNIM